MTVVLSSPTDLDEFLVDDELELDSIEDPVDTEEALFAARRKLLRWVLTRMVITVILCLTRFLWWPFLRYQGERLFKGIVNLLDNIQQLPLTIGEIIGEAKDSHDEVKAEPLAQCAQGDLEVPPRYLDRSTQTTQPAPRSIKLFEQHRNRRLLDFTGPQPRKDQNIPTITPEEPQIAFRSPYSPRYTKKSAFYR